MCHLLVLTHGMQMGAHMTCSLAPFEHKRAIYSTRLICASHASLSFVTAVVVHLQLLLSALTFYFEEAPFIGCHLSLHLTVNVHFTIVWQITPCVEGGDCDRLTGVIFWTSAPREMTRIINNCRRGFSFVQKEVSPSVNPQAHNDDFKHSRVALIR